MDFVTHLPRTQQRHDAVWVIVDRLTKSVHFLVVRMTFALERFCRLYIRDIVRLHGVLVSIASDRDPRFMVHFWKSFQKAMGTRLTMSTTFHPQTNGQSERTIQVLEDMLGACVLDHKGSWDEHLPLVDVRRRPLEFEVGDHVFLKVMPKRGVVKFGKRRKLSPRFIGPFEFLKRIGAVAYRLALPPSMSGVHEVFHVSMLRKYTPDPAHVVDWGQIEVDTDGTFEEGPVCIVDSRDQVLRRKTVRLVLVLWRHYGVEEYTWEREDTMRATYPFLFRDEGT